MNGLCRWMGLLALVLLVAGPLPAVRAAPPQRDAAIPILVYHRFSANSAGSTTIRDATLEWQLLWLKEHGYTVIPLRAALDYLLHGGPPPDRAVVITVDDGHRSVYTDLLPLVRKYQVPVTLFIYPSAISNASYALTWPQLVELRQTGWFDVQSHTWWHPDFRVERRRLGPAQYEAFVATQLLRSRTILDQHLGGHVDVLAWPYGIVDPQLMAQAAAAGYVAALALEERMARPGDPPMALPREVVSDSARGAAFARLVGAAGGVAATAAPTGTGP